MDGPEAVEGVAVAHESLPNFGDVLIESATPDVGMDAPNRMNQAVSADNHARIHVQVIENPDFLAPQFITLQGPE